MKSPLAPGVLACLGLLSLAAYADSLNDIPKATNEVKAAMSKAKTALTAKNFVNPAKREQFDKDLKEFAEAVKTFAAAVEKADGGDLLEKAQVPQAKTNLAEALVQLTEASWTGCDYERVKETVDASAEIVTKKSDQGKLLRLKALAFQRLIRFADAEGTCEALARVGEGAKAAAMIKADLKEKKTDIKNGKPITSFGFRGINGEKIAVPEGLTGKVVLIDFWATWCGPCKEEMPNVIKLYNELHDQGFEVVGISLDTEIESVKQYIEENKMPWPQYFDGKKWENYISTYFGVTGIPKTVVLDRTGKVKYQDVRGAELADKVRDLLKGKN